MVDSRFSSLDCVFPTKARGQVFAVLFGLLLWLPFTDSVIATVLALAWYGFAGGALLSAKPQFVDYSTGVIAYRNFEMSSR